MTDALTQATIIITILTTTITTTIASHHQHHHLAVVPRSRSIRTAPPPARLKARAPSPERIAKQRDGGDRKRGGPCANTGIITGPGLSELKESIYLVV